MGAALSLVLRGAGLCGYAAFAAAYKMWDGSSHYEKVFLTVSVAAFLFSLGGVVVFWKVEPSTIVQLEMPINRGHTGSPPKDLKMQCLEATTRFEPDGSSALQVARLEMTPKLFALTFLMVAYGGNDLTSERRLPMRAPCSPVHLVCLESLCACACACKRRRSMPRQAAHIPNASGTWFPKGCVC